MTNMEIALGVIRVATKEGIGLSVHDSGRLVVSYVEGQEPSETLSEFILECSPDIVSALRDISNV